MHVSDRFHGNPQPGSLSGYGNGGGGQHPGPDGGPHGGGNGGDGQPWGGGSNPHGGGLSDGQLLEHYLTYREDAAFAALVRRHWAMVLGVCRRLLRDIHDADDAFQATFLVFLRKVRAIRKRTSLALNPQR